MKSLSKRLLGTGLALPLTVLVYSVALAGPIEDRQAKMKIVGKSMSVVAKMAKGDTEYNGDAALQAYVDMKNAVVGLGDLFPDGSGEGKTEAAPAIVAGRRAPGETPRPEHPTHAELRRDPGAGSPAKT